MPVATWPVGLPQIPTLAGFSVVAAHAPLAVTEPEDGPAISRVQSQTRITQLAYRLLFTDGQYATWLAFVETTLSQGSAHFTMSVPAVGRTFATKRVYIKNGDWKADPVGRNWAVTFTLCVLPYA